VAGADQMPATSFVLQLRIDAGTGNHGWLENLLRLVREAVASGAVNGCDTGSKPPDAASRTARVGHLGSELEQFSAERAVAGRADGPKCAGIAERVAAAKGWGSLAEFTRAGIIEFFADYMDRPMKIGKAEPAPNGKCPSAKTYNNMLTALRLVLAWALTVEIVKENVAASILLREEDGEHGVRALKVEEVRRLVAAAKEQEAQHRRCKGKRSVFYLFLAHTGLRPAEAMRVQWGDLFIDAPPFRMLVRKGVARKSRKPASLPLHPEIAAALGELRNGAGAADPLFRYRPSHHTVDADLQRAGIPKTDDRGISAAAYSLRKYLATHHGILGTPDALRKLVTRHATIEETDRHYTDPSWGDLKAAADRMPSLNQIVQNLAQSAISPQIDPTYEGFTPGANGHRKPGGRITPLTTRGDSADSGGATLMEKTTMVCAPPQPGQKNRPADAGAFSPVSQPVADHARSRDGFSALVDGEWSRGELSPSAQSGSFEDRALGLLGRIVALRERGRQ
jgi:integrase